ncbi:MAG: hypothetical protein IT377_12290 [Polyangiaceae bacterium]|nr:hypothetical protein [Polyangiaceae bacterium]
MMKGLRSVLWVSILVPASFMACSSDDGGGGSGGASATGGAGGGSGAGGSAGTGGSSGGGGSAGSSGSSGAGGSGGSGGSSGSDGSAGTGGGTPDASPGDAPSDSPIEGGGDAGASLCAGTGAIVATCAIKASGGHTCTEIHGTPASDAKSNCIGAGGTYTVTSSPCDKNNVIGRCKRSASGSCSEGFYYSDGLPAASAKMQCQYSAGTWADG